MNVTLWYIVGVLSLLVALAVTYSEWQQRKR
jgi:hypothetical protein